MKKLSKLGKALSKAEQKEVLGGGKRNVGIFEACGPQHEGGSCSTDSDCPDPAECSIDGWSSTGICTCDSGGSIGGGTFN